MIRRYEVSTRWVVLAALWTTSACYSPSLDVGVPDVGQREVDQSEVDQRSASAAAGAQGNGPAERPAPTISANVAGPPDERVNTGIQPPVHTAVANEPKPQPNAAPVVETLGLPSVCVGLGYSARLEATGGSGPPYRWSLVETLPGLEIDAETGELRGTPEATGSLRVRVRDAKNAQGERVFALSQKGVCHLAYLALREGTTRLHLRDVFGQFDVTLPADGATDRSVLDFEFSPAGNWLALRIREAGGDHLYLYDTAFTAVPSAGAELVPVRFACPAADAACSVIDYAWSENSRYLAVALEAGVPEQDYLTGLDVQRPSQTWPLLGTALWNEVLPIALDYRSGLVWVGSSWVAFIGPESDDLDPEFESEFETLYTAVLTESRDALDGLIGTASESGPGPILRSAGSGVVLSYTYPGEEIRDINFSERGLPNGLGVDVKQAYVGWVSPSGQLLASIDTQRRLQIFELGSDEPATESDRDGCWDVITWSERREGRERIVCSHGSIDRQHARVFDYFPDERRLSEPNDTPAEVSAVQAPLRRGVSISGDWLVLMSDTGKSRLVEISQFPAQVDEYGPTLSASAQMAFAPSRSAVALLDGDTLFELPLPLERGEARSFAIPGLAPTQPCQPSFWKAPAQWCGATQIKDQLLYSADSEAALFEGPAGSLRLVDLASSSQPPAVELTQDLPPCVAPCGGRFAFKP